MSIEVGAVKGVSKIGFENITIGLASNADGIVVTDAARMPHSMILVAPMLAARKDTASRTVIDKVMIAIKESAVTTIGILVFAIYIVYRWIEAVKAKAKKSVTK